MAEQKQEILLESGTNEIEIMEFKIGNDYFGINVAKVKEIMLAVPVKPMPKSHPSVEGIFKPRDAVLTLVDLPGYLNMEKTEETRDLFIITGFNKREIAFRVHSVLGISRISWMDIQKPDEVIYGGVDSGIVTGIARCGERLVTVLDFEKIIAEIAPETSIQMSEIDQLGERDMEEDRTILIAEDSMLLSKLIHEALHKAGYVNTIKCDNGKEAWDFLSQLKGVNDPRQEVSLIITDIEMPQMDGHHLTKLIKEDNNLKKIPVVIFSSLIDKDMYAKGVSLGADAQLSKPEIGNLVSTIDRLIEEYEHKF